jgi:hypothetical protein
MNMLLFKNKLSLTFSLIAFLFILLNSSCQNEQINKQKNTSNCVLTLEDSDYQIEYRYASLYVLQKVFERDDFCVDTISTKTIIELDNMINVILNDLIKQIELTEVYKKDPTVINRNNLLTTFKSK